MEVRTNILAVRHQDQIISLWCSIMTNCYRTEYNQVMFILQLGVDTCFPLDINYRNRHRRERCGPWGGACRVPGRHRWEQAAAFAQNSSNAGSISRGLLM